MSFLQKAIDATAEIDGLNGLATALQRLHDVNGGLETTAAAAQVAAEPAIAGVVTATVRTSMSMVRLGLAISGQTSKWEAISWAAGADAGLTAGAIIDWVNEQHYGDEFYDWLHEGVDPFDMKYDAIGNPTGIRRDVNDAYRTALTPPRARDPLAIDLDGIETVGITATPVLFDHNADGIRTGTGWVRGDDAFVLDRNGNGSIDSGGELFGVDTVITVTELVPGSFTPRTVTRNAHTGFEALRTLDTGDGNTGSAGYGDGDGVFNANDAAFSEVRLWQDVNQDGVSQANELSSLVDQGISSIALTENTTTTDLGNGNTVTGQAVVTRSNGSTTQIDSVALQASNLNLAANSFYREFTDTITLSAAARALPEMGGSGWVRDMREAMQS